MRISVLIGTYGDRAVWEPLSDRAYVSAQPQLVEGDQLLRYHRPEGTLAEVRNELARCADKDWLCFLDGDDELAPGYLEEMRNASWRRLRCGGTGGELFSPAVQYVDAKGYDTPPALPNRHRPMVDLNHCVIGTLVPRDLFLEVGGFRELAMYEDWALFLACVRAGATIVDVPDAVYRAHERPGSRNKAESGIAAATYQKIRGEHIDAVTRGAVFI